MSFVKTLATLAIGFAAAKGVDKFRKSGGLDGLKDKLRGAGEQGGLADQFSDTAGKLGLPVDASQMREMFDRYGKMAAASTEAAETGMGNLIGAMTSAAKQGAGQMSDLYETLTSGSPVGAASEDQAKLMIRAMVMAAKSDGEIDAEERGKILDHLKDASPEEIAFVESALDAPVDVTALAAESAQESAAQVYSAALMAITVDTEAERAFLRGLAGALGLDEARLAALHQAMGRPQL